MYPKILIEVSEEPNADLVGKLCVNVVQQDNKNTSQVQFFGNGAGLEDGYVLLPLKKKNEK